MNSVRNIAFVCLVAVFAFSVIGYSCLGHVMPGVIDKPKHSAVEKRDYVQMKDVLALSFMDGKAQDKFEQYAADGMPFRNELIFGNARIQRMSIKGGAWLFGFNTYPTYFNSEFNEVADSQYLVRKSLRNPTNELAAREAWITTLNEVAKIHPEIRFNVTVLADSRQTAMNPTAKLMSGDVATE